MDDGMTFLAVWLVLAVVWYSAYLFGRSCEARRCNEYVSRLRRESRK